MLIRPGVLDSFGTMLTDPQLAPYLTELGRTTSTALTHFERLETAAGIWVRFRGALEPPSQSSQAAEAQDLAFEALEGFLAAWARASLLVYPTTRGDFGQRRGQTLRVVLRLPDATLDDRDLRDSWAHCDERIDAVVSQGHFGSLQRFMLAGEVTEKVVHETPRVLVMDTLQVFYHTRDGTRAQSNLRTLVAALLNVQAAVDSAWLHYLDAPREMSDLG